MQIMINTRLILNKEQFSMLEYPKVPYFQILVRHWLLNHHFVLIQILSYLDIINECMSTTIRHVIANGRLPAQPSSHTVYISLTLNPINRGGPTIRPKGVRTPPYDYTIHEFQFFNQSISIKLVLNIGLIPSYTPLRFCNLSFSSIFSLIILKIGLILSLKTSRISHNQ